MSDHAWTDASGHVFVALEPYWKGSNSGQGALGAGAARLVMSFRGSGTRLTWRGIGPSGCQGHESDHT
jgi:hypothetical protein